MKRALMLALLLAILLPLCSFSQEAKAETLGPLVDRSEELNVTALIEIHCPRNITYSAGEILLNFTLIYEGQDYDVGYSVDGGAIERISVSKISEEPAPYLLMPPYVKVTCRGTMILRDLLDGNHAVTVYGGYFFGGIIQRYEVFKRASISFAVDTVPPIISLFSIENKTYEKPDISLNFTVNEPSSKFAYSLDGQDNVTISGNTTLTGIPYGEHNVTVYATDELGNTGASETIFFNIPEPPEPFPTSLVVASVIIVTIVVFAVFLAYQRKHKHQGLVKNL
jgi:hypothetical protein